MVVLLVHRAGRIVHRSMGGVVVTTRAVGSTHRHGHRVVSAVVEAAGVTQAAVASCVVRTGRSRSLVGGGVHRAVQAQRASEQARRLVLAETAQTHLREKNEMKRKRGEYR